MHREQPVVKVSVDTSVVIALWVRDEFGLAIEVHEFGGTLIFPVKLPPKLKTVPLNIDSECPAPIIYVSPNVTTNERPKFLS